MRNLPVSKKLKAPDFSEGFESEQFNCVSARILPSSVDSSMK